MAKPRYWHAAFPLAIISLCVAPQAFFLKNWMSCLEASISKLKVCHQTFLIKFVTITFTGKGHTDDSLEWNSSIIMDLLVPLPGICFNDNCQAGYAA